MPRRRPARHKPRRAPAEQPVSAGAGISVAAAALRERALAAFEKRRAGKQLTASEINAIEKLERSREAEAREAAFRRCSGEDLRTILGGVSRQQIQRLRGYGLPVNDDNSYSLYLAVPFYIEHERRRLKAAQAPALSALEQKRMVELEALRRADAVKRGELLPRALAEAELERAGREISEELLGWAGGLAPKLAGQDHRAVAATLTVEVRRVLGRLSADRIREASGG